MHRTLPMVHIDQLQPGMFVSLNLGWLDHPFLVNSFLIKEAEQLATLRELGLSHVAYDPQRSKSKPLVLQSDPAACASGHITPENQRLMDEKRTRTGRMAQHREHLLLFEREYEEAIGATKNIHTEILRQPQRAIAQAAAMSEQLNAAFLDDQGATVMMVASNKVDDLSHQHALNVMILTLLICKGLGVNRQVMNAAGMGALLHDIGKTSISKTVLRKSPRNRSEETLYRLHCEYGVNIIGEHANLGVRAVVGQHHEYFDGSGFPHGSQGAQINPLARIVTIADRYDSLCNPLRLADALPPAEALSTMFAHEAKLFDATMLAVFIRELGVYPPGSLVQLSNGAIAMVIAAASGNTLKPKVLIYEPGVPRSEAIVINLTESLQVRIDSVLKPAALEHSVIDYLNPRMRVAYHVQKTDT
ncbi:MAG: HD-GYP domain-containing protein [Rhodoferax sp.]